ncbi:MAG TPA: cation:proton antiporter [Verrucomicrobiales bacterium]|nr:cation:proton antiporter [Verrucomicrobiales bacterium]
MPCLPIPLFASSSEGSLLPLLALTLLLTVGMALLLRRLQFPALPGFFLCGFLLARTGMIEGMEESLVHMGDVGVILLLFTIGTECSAHELKMLKKNGLRAGILQLVFTLLAFALVAMACGQSFGAALVWGLIGAVSSTAVGVKLFEDCGVAGHPASRLSLGIALVQDLMVILALLLLPGLTSSGGLFEVAKASGKLVLEGIAFVTAAALLSRWGIPQLLKAVSRTRARDLFTLTVLALCAGIASLGNFLELGYTVGAFAAGVAVSGSVYSHRILADAAPFRDFFLTIFFLSVGALVKPQILIDQWMLILGLSVFVLAAKTALTATAARVSGAPVATGLLAGVALAGVGEFAIVLGREARSRGLVAQDSLDLVLAVTAVTLSLSPLLMRAVLPAVSKLEARPAPEAVPDKKRAAGFSKRVKEMENHAILCGYGTVGQILHKGLNRLGIPVVIIELNSDTVASLLKKGHPVLFADISQADTMELAGVTRARMIIISFPHAEIARAAITIARERNPAILTMCRARFPHEAAMLRQLAPDNVVHDEMEAGIKMLRLCARGYERDEADLFPNVGV